MSLAGIVLAAGVGSRFDPSRKRFKLTEGLADGRPVIVGACQAIQPHVDRLLVVTGERSHDVQSALAILPSIQQIHCPRASHGMGASIKAGIAASPGAGGWLIALGDMPYVDHSTVVAVSKALMEGVHIARPRYRGRPGHPVGFSAFLYDDLLQIEDKAGAAGLLNELRDQVVFIETQDPGCVFDIDYPDDLRAPLFNGVPM